MIEVWKAIGFMALGAVIAEYYDWRAWKRYYAGRREREK